MKVSSAMKVEDLIEAEPAPAEEELGRESVAGDSITVLNHGADISTPGDLAKSGGGKLSDGLPEHCVPPPTNIQDDLIFAERICYKCLK